ncbi:MAG TPA: cyclic nucleotide-binding domain-containing protein [Ktedonobacteraceae bacterium]|nr:cyclic nucleotide-binding domain-containing protein [Ktedonobacteraceae bacterium]
MSVQSERQPLVVGIQHRTDLVPLTEDEVTFEIDMCIGCNRCMRACPVPLSSQVSIADLNLATISDEIAPHVAKFTDQCVMCGSCVPVCPVNNHRDLLMLSLKQRLGISWDGNVDMSRVLDYLPVGWNVMLLLSRLREQPMFSDPQQLPDNYLLHFIADSKIESVLPGTVVLHEGEYGRNMLLILEGRFTISSAGPNGADVPAAVLRRGEFMGERGMLTGQQRNATARAQTAAVVLDVPEQVMQRMMEIVPAVRNFFERLNNARSIESVLKRMAVFQGISGQDMSWIASKIQFKNYDRDEPLFTESDAGQPARESLHIIIEGFVKVARRTTARTGRNKTDERIIAYRQGGDYFAGGLDLLGDGRAVTVTAINRVRVAEIPRQDMLTLLGRYPEVNQRFLTHLQEYRTAAEAAQTFIGPMDFLRSASSQSFADAEARAGLGALVGGGVVEGTEVLVIDLDKCVHCDKCEDACERRHGHSRMNRKGMVVGNISIATACRQCQDPVCMLCSRAGIARMPSGEVYITESCIGCGICAERCPYDNISIVSLADEVEERSALQRFASFFTKGTGTERGKKMLPMANNIASPGPLNIQQPLDAFGEMRKKLAIKCDLCAGYNNQACVQACPTGAAFRTQPVQFFGSTEEILQRRVQ